jgi:hypothetical protein
MEVMLQNGIGQEGNAAYRHPVLFEGLEITQDRELCEKFM